MTDILLPLECWLEIQSKNGNHFPNGNTDYFDRYKGIKKYLKDNVYKYIPAATSAEDQGVYTDHGIDHFNAVIRYAGKLLGLPNVPSPEDPLCITPYETFVLLVSILLHDAGNIFGRQGHEKHPLKIYKDMGPYICPDNFEAKIIAQIASAHGGKAILADGSTCKDTIGNSVLNENEPIHDINVRQKFIAALVRFSDEICEDRSRSARFLLGHDALPKWSEIYHAYANSITSVGVDHESKSINIKIELLREQVINQYGKGSKESTENCFLIDEIFLRLEKMYNELLYCHRFMYEHINLNRIRATISIYDEDMELLKEKAFELKEKGYPDNSLFLIADHPEWDGQALKDQMAPNQG